jgi:hypothetical protein
MERAASAQNHPGAMHLVNAGSPLGGGPLGDWRAGEVTPYHRRFRRPAAARVGEAPLCAIVQGVVG